MISRLKFDISNLFKEIYDERLPESVFISGETTFSDLQSAGLQSIVPLVDKLRQYGHSDENIRGRVFAFMENDVYLNYVMVKYKNLPVTFGIYKESINMKFDVVVGNPPYQEKVGPKKTEALWPKFVKKSFELVKENGFVSLIHPSGWRNVDGKFKVVQKLLTSKDMYYLEMHNEKDGMVLFGAETRYDWYVVQNSENNNILTEVKGQDGISIQIDLKNKEFIPSGYIEKIYSLVANDGEKKVNILSDSSYHTQRSFMSKVNEYEFIYPCVYTVKSGDNGTFWYSNTNGNGHFNSPKLIWSNFRISSAGSILDLNGDYGLTQFSYAIVDSIENLPSIKNVFDGVLFRNLMESCAVSDMSINRKIIATFRKDFWKEFINE